MTQQHLTDHYFSSLNLPKELLQGVEQAGFSRCTPIQWATLPLTLKGRDVAGQAQTGSGKTAAFLLATMNHLLTRPPAPVHNSDQPRALILAPTRELAMQIHKDAEVLGRHTELRLALAYGGTGYDQQRQTIANGVDILIGTPGRLIDYFKQRVYHLRDAQVVVIDEADRMFDLGFIRDVRYLLRRCPEPEKRLGLLFSATLSLRVSELAYEHMNDPQLVRIEGQGVTVDTVRQTLYHISNNEKISLLIGLLKHIDPHRTLIFVNTKRDGERVWAYLEGNGFESALLSGDVPQTTRQRLLAQFQKGELPMLVATDVAARGLHIASVSHVINYDLPQDAEDYVHRIGRTARLGAEGDAISFACETYVYSLPDIEEYLGHKIPVSPVSPELLLEPKPPAKRIRKPRRPRSDGRRNRGSRRTAGNRNA